MARHVIVGGGTAGHNAVNSIRQEERGGRSEIVLVSAERPYSRMVLPYYLGRTIAESHVYTASPARLAQLGVTTHLGRRATGLDPKSAKLTLDDGTAVEYDDLLVATGSSAVRPPVPGADGAGVHSFWTLEQARHVVAEIQTGSHVVMVGAGFIAFTILNSILALGAKLTILEIAPQILPRMIDATGAGLVETWLRTHGVEVRTGVTLTAVEQAGGKRRLRFKDGQSLDADVVIMATGIRTNLDWLQGSGIRVNRAVVVDDHLRSSVANVYAAGDVAEGRDLVTGQPDVHAIEPTAMEHGRVVGANMAGRDVGVPRQPPHEHRRGVSPGRRELRPMGRLEGRGRDHGPARGARLPEASLARGSPHRGDDPRALRRHLDHQRRRDAQGPGPDRGAARPVEGAPPAKPVRRQAGLHRVAHDPAAPSGDRPRPALRRPRGRVGVKRDLVAPVDPSPATGRHRPKAVRSGTFKSGVVGWPKAGGRRRVAGGLD